MVKIEGDSAVCERALTSYYSRLALIMQKFVFEILPHNTGDYARQWLDFLKDFPNLERILSRRERG